MKHLMFLAGLLEAAGIAEGGRDLFVGTLPSDVAKGVMLVDPLTGHEIDEGMRGFFASDFQAIVRDPDPLDGYARALAISAALTLADTGNDEVFVTWCRPMTLPISYPRGDADDIETSVRFRIGFGLKVHGD
ncbi:MAG TPA: minor capsid protein [Candidatus Sphingomonas excrementigallinarum]|nr:minor capsid protein [Candidatus Sphingomonas excrementigallinarum]